MLNTDNHRKIRWGLMGAGNILNRWMNGALQFDDMEIAAIASRTPQKAQLRADRFGIPSVLSYEELVSRPDIDVVYVNSIHPAHCELAMLAMEHGKAVLVEKPAAVCESDFIKMTECAKENDVFMMEALWTRFFPLVDKILAVIDSGEIGKIQFIESTFSFAAGGAEKCPRLYDPMQAGGGLLDVGVYNLHLSDIIMRKKPVRLSGTCSLTSGIDESAAMIARYDTGELSVMSCGISADLPETAYIYGTKGSIEIPHFFKPVKAVIRCGENVRIIEHEVPQRKAGIIDEGFGYEIAYVNECIRNNVKIPQFASWDKSQEILRECDMLRREWGLKFPFEP